MNSFIVFFDGSCVFCNFWVKKLLQWDKSDRMRFSSLQSPFATRFFKEHSSQLLAKDALITWEQTKGCQSEADAVFAILDQLGGLFVLFKVFRIIPTSFLNVLYRFIAKNRYKWFGNQSNCDLTPKNQSHKFLK